MHDCDALGVEHDGVDGIDIIAIPVALEREVLGLHGILHMLNSHAPLNRAHLRVPRVSQAFCTDTYL